MNKQLTPPRYALRFLRWFCREDYLEEIEGDLIEIFEIQVENSQRKANWKFTWSVVRYFRPEFIKSFKTYNSPNLIAMLLHNLLITFRTFKRYKSSFLINLVGLSTGLSCAFLIYLWVLDELHVDKFLEKDNQLFQVMQNMHHTHGIETIEATPSLLANALSEEIPEVEYSVAVIPSSFNASKGIISVKDTYIRSSGQFAQKDFFNVFSYNLLYGDKKQVLAEKNSVVISKELALKLFESVENAVGKTITWKTQDIDELCMITGIFESLPSNATNQFDLILNYKLFEGNDPSTGWGENVPRTYILLKSDAIPNQVNVKIRNFIQSKVNDTKTTLFLQQYSNRYLYSFYENGISSGGRIEYVKLFSIIAILTLMIACINFMNLSTAKATRRQKEVGIKKSIGVNRKTLILQYLGESTMMVFLSLTLAILIVMLSLPHFNQMTGKQLALNFNFNLILTVLGITLFTGLIAGSYPALYLSSFNPVTVLKSRLHYSFGEELVRKGLVVFQFVISTILIVSVLVVYKQIEFVQSKNLGYNRDHVIYFNTENMSDAFVSEVKNIPGVLQVGGGNLEVGKPLGGTNGIDWEGKSPDDKTFFSIKWVSYYLIETLGMEIIAGKSFSEDFGSNDQIIFNETAIASMSLNDPIGKNVTIEGEKRQIVGVVKNFNFESLYEEVKPCALLIAPMKFAPKISVKIQAGTEKTTIENLQQIYQKFNQGLFEFKFMEDDYQYLYASEKRVAALSRYFAVLAILISCLGLFGLATFTAERRLKEIGIRKILGSSTLNIIRLLSADFTGMVLLAIVIALPVSYIITRSWLQNFAFSISLEWWYFASAGFAALLITWLTIGIQTIKTAHINPVNCLKNE